jgi:hypothetical protein
MHKQMIMMYNPVLIQGQCTGEPTRDLCFSIKAVLTDINLIAILAIHRRWPQVKTRWNLKPGVT